jgi:hypothetical protein
MIERHTHPTNARNVDARETFAETIEGLNLGRTEKRRPEKSGGRQEARTPDLRVANAALSQLS